MLSKTVIVAITWLAFLNAGAALLVAVSCARKLSETGKKNFLLGVYLFLAGSGFSLLSLISIYGFKSFPGFQRALLNFHSLAAGATVLFFTPLLISSVLQRTRHEGRGRRGWVLITLLFSISGYASFRISADAEQRGLNPKLSAALALLVTLVPFQPGICLEVMHLLSKGFGGWAIWLLVAVVLADGAGLMVYLLLRPPVVHPFISVETIEKSHPRISSGPDGAIVVAQGLKKYFSVTTGLFGKALGEVRAVDVVDIFVRRGETLGLVGDSGCGKTTVGRLLLGLLPKSSGKIYFEGFDLDELDPEEMRLLRRKMQLIFQDPIGSLNPRMSVGEIVGEALVIHNVARGRTHIERRGEVREKVQMILERVGRPADSVDRYPHEFSGGQRQRIGIARAIALSPSFIVCDEPVSALDVSIQAQIINLLKDLQEELGLSYLFIAHDLNVIEHISHRVAVMYLGLIVEEAQGEELFRNPLHPYTRALLAAIPVPEPKGKRKKIMLPGDVPSAMEPPRGCRFHTRCPNAMALCREAPPQLLEVAPGHRVACFLYENQE